MLACLRLRRSSTFSKQHACAELKTKAAAFKVGHVIPISLLTVDNVTVGDYIADDNVQQCVCVCTDLCSKPLSLKGGSGMGRDPSVAYMLCKMHRYRRKAALFCAVSCTRYMVTWSGAELKNCRPRALE